MFCVGTRNSVGTGARSASVSTRFRVSQCSTSFSRSFYKVFDHYTGCFRDHANEKEMPRHVTRSQSKLRISEKPIKSLDFWEANQISGFLSSPWLGVYINFARPKSTTSFYLRSKWLDVFFSRSGCSLVFAWYGLLWKRMVILLWGSQTTMDGALLLGITIFQFFWTVVFNLNANIQFSYSLLLLSRYFKTYLC